MVFDPVMPGLTAGINGIVGTLAKVAIEAAAKRGAAKSQELSTELSLQLARTAHQYAEKYYNRHGLVKALGMNEPMSLDDLYIAVNVLGNDLASCFASLQSQEDLYRTQEYLTALHIVERNLSDDLVSDYLFDRNWREVFILVAGIRQPDQLCWRWKVRFIAI
jgi:hypothetical protein